MDNTTTVHMHSHNDCVVAVPGPHCIIQRYKNMRHMNSSYIAAGLGTLACAGDLDLRINTKSQSFWNSTQYTHQPSSKALPPPKYGEDLMTPDPQPLPINPHNPGPRPFAP